MQPIVVTLDADESGEATSRMIRLDTLRTSGRIGLACTIVGGASLGNGSYSVEYSYDDPCDLVNPVPVDQMTWLTDMSPFVNMNESKSGFMPTAPLYLRLALVGTQGGIRLTVMQYRHHI